MHNTGKMWNHQKICQVQKVKNKCENIFLNCCNTFEPEKDESFKNLHFSEKIFCLVF